MKRDQRSEANHERERRHTSKHVPALYIAIRTSVFMHDQAVKLHSVVRVIVVDS